MSTPHDPPRQGEDVGQARGEFRGALDVSLDLPLASLGTRSLAQFIDLLVVVVLILVGAAVVTIAPVQGEARWWAIATMIVFDFVLIWGYFVASEQLTRGQSLGKWLLGLRVVTLDGTPPGPAASLIRNLVRYADFLPPFYGFGSLSILLTERAQRLGDLAAGTVVVREPHVPDTFAIARWPKGIAAEDIPMVEEYFERLKSLPLVRAREISNAMLAWLSSRHPEFTGPVPEGISPERFLEDCFSERGSAPRGEDGSGRPASVDP